MTTYVELPPELKGSLIVEGNHHSWRIKSTEEGFVVGEKGKLTLLDSSGNRLIIDDSSKNKAAIVHTQQGDQKPSFYTRVPNSVRRVVTKGIVVGYETG